MSSKHSTLSASYGELIDLLREVATLSSVSNLLAWDQETMMPPKAVEFRAEQTALITGLAHVRACDARIGDLLTSCETDPALVSDAAISANLREIRRQYERQRQLPSELVEEISQTNSLAIEAWKKARHDNDFAAFQPWLERQVTLARRKADCYGTPEGGESYDALLQDFEPDISTATLEGIFKPLRHELIALIDEIDAASRRPADLTPTLDLPVPSQEQFVASVMKRIGFDLEAGRVDISTHPFSTSISPGDTRLTTRYSGGFLDALSSSMHEAGHALYEQGMPKAEHPGQPLGECASLGIHESQSRMWENEIGRSLAFWQWALPEARKHFGAAFENLTADRMYEACNVVRRSLIRTESDELTYNLHIMLRFDLERAMIAGDLAVKDLPDQWNARMRSDLGVDVPDDSQGCLQDIHWAMGAFGYFPSYALGNLYAAQFWNALHRAHPEIEQQIARGEFDLFLSWLRENIHCHGRRFTAPELCRHVTGSDLNPSALIDRLKAKFHSIYDVSCPT